MDRKNERLQRITHDVELITKACKSDNDCPFCEFEFNENVFSFEYRSRSIKTFYWVTMTDDYPDHSALTWCNNDSDATHNVSHFNERLPVRFNKIAKELYKDMKLDDSDFVNISSLSKVSESKSFKSSAGVVTSSTRHLVYQSKHYQSSDEDEDEEDDMDNEDDDMFGEVGDECVMDECEAASMNSQLMQDIEAVKSVYGADSIVTRVYKPIDDCDVELHVPVNNLHEEVSLAWKLIPRKPLIIILHVSPFSYLNTEQPKLEVYQVNSSAAKEKQGIHCQLEKILEKFLCDNWAQTSSLVRSKNSSVHAVSGDSVANKFHPEADCNRSWTVSSVKPSTDLSSDFSFKCLKLVELLATTELEAANALRACNNDVNAAAELLLAGSSSSDGNKQSLRKMRPQQPARSQPTTLISKESTGNNKKQVPSLEHGFLVQVMKYIEQRLQTLNEFCVICDETHVFESSNMLKPTVCSRDLCVFAFQTLGVMSNAADDVATAAEVVDLLIAMANTACRSTRKKIIFEPYPTVVHPTKSNDYIFHPKSKDFVQVQKTLDNIPAMSDMVNMSGGELKKTMDATDRYAYPLLQWIISSNRCHIVKLPPGKQLDFMKTQHQFLLQSSPPAKEAVFSEARKQHGSTFAFHGSNIENWHSIMRRGLLNCSGTALQLNGAAHGSGVYLSPSAFLSFGYSTQHLRHTRPTVPAAQETQKNRRFLTSKNITCIALCEVVTCPELQKSGPIWVMPHADYVCTRFFFVYESTMLGDQTVHTESHDVLSKIRNAMCHVYGSSASTI